MRYNPDIQYSTQKAFVDTVIKTGSKYKNSVVLDANLSSIIGTQNFAKAFPERHFNFGNAVENMLGAAVGFAARGKIPFVCSYALSITGESWDQIRNYICCPNVNVKIIGTHAGLLRGEEGAMYQSLEDIAIMTGGTLLSLFWSF